MNNVIVWLVVGAIVLFAFAGVWTVGLWFSSLMDEGEDGILI